MVVAVVAIARAWGAYGGGEIPASGVFAVVSAACNAMLVWACIVLFLLKVRGDVFVWQSFVLGGRLRATGDIRLLRASPQALHYYRQ